MNENWAKLCPGCFLDKGKETVCPHCGYDESIRQGQLILPHRTLLQEQYLLGAVLGKPGGFGITYLAFDTRLETMVAIKEYLPRDLAGREVGGITVSAHSQDDGKLFLFGLQQFLREARTLAKFDHAHVVRVRNVFEENGTAYLVMDYYQGMSLAEYLEKKGRLSEKIALDILMPILDGLREVHGKGFLHRDIKPQNIYLTKEGRPILLDFGSARMAMGEHSNTLSVVLTPGYAPFEQYHRKGEQGPWTDIYSCAAILYQMLTGETPPEAPERAEHDGLKPPITLVPDLSPLINQAILAGLAPKAAARPQSVREFQDRLRFKPISNPALKVNIYAGFWKRAAAIAIDCVVVGVMMFMVDIVIGLVTGLSGLSNAVESLESLVNAISLLFNWMYFAGLESSPHQATVGKMALNIKVTDLEGRRISFWRATGRYFGKFVSGLSLGIGFAMAGFTDRKQALHDRIAKCVVVDKSILAPNTETSITGITQEIWIGVGGLLIALSAWFNISAKNEISQQTQNLKETEAQEARSRANHEEVKRQEAQLQAERDEVKRRAAQLQTERDEIRQRETQLQAEREEAARQQAQSQAEREETQRREAQLQPVRTVVAYYRSLGHDTQAALNMWTDSYNRPKLAKLIANTEYAEVKGAKIDAYDGQFARIWIDVTVKAKDTPPQQWQGAVELEAVAGRWLITSLKGLSEVK